MMTTPATLKKKKKTDSGRRSAGYALNRPISSEKE